MDLWNRKTKIEGMLGFDLICIIIFDSQFLELSKMKIIRIKSDFITY